MANKTATIPTIATGTQGTVQTVYVAVRTRTSKSAGVVAGAEASNIAPTTGQIWPRGVVK